MNAPSNEALGAEVHSSIESDHVTETALLEIQSAIRTRMAIESASDPWWVDKVAAQMIGSAGCKYPDLQVEILVLLSQWYMAEGRWEDGMAVLEPALSITETRGNTKPRTASPKSYGRYCRPKRLAGRVDSPFQRGNLSGRTNRRPNGKGRDSRQSCGG